MVQRSGWITTFLFLMLVQSVFSEAENIGDFDINKVREAIQHTDSGLGEAGSVLPATRSESATTLALRITLYLGIVIVLIIGVAWFVRKSGLPSARGNSGGAMDVIETLPIGQNRMISMVRVLDEIYLISQTANTISLLDKIGGDKALEIISDSKGGGTIMPFKEAFDTFMGKIKKTS